MTPFITIGLGALAAVAIAELVARAALRRGGYYAWPPLYRRRLVLDRDTNPELEPVARFEINSDGERAGEFPCEAGVFRILIAGASSVECVLIDQPTAWPARVETILNEPAHLRALGARRVHLGAVAKSGMDSRAVDLILERILPRYRRLDLIAIMAGVGDIFKWLESGGIANSPHPQLSVDSCFAVHPERVYGWNLRALALRELAKRLWRAVFRPVSVRDQGGSWMRRAREMRQRAKETITVPAEATASLDLFEHHLRRAVRRSLAASRQVMILRQPVFRKTRYTPEEDALFWGGGLGNAYRGDDISTYYSNDAFFALVTRFEARIAKVVAELRVPYVDTMPALSMDAKTFFDHVHLTPSGCAKLAPRVAQAILDFASPRAGGNEV